MPKPKASSPAQPQSIAPLAGGPKAELLELFRLPLQTRQQELWSDIEAGLRTLESQDRLTAEDIVRSDAFMDAAIRGLEAARKTGNVEKRTALRNAVLNAALDTPPDESLRQVFLDLIDRFTVWHLRILKAFNDPLAWRNAHNVSYRPGLSSSSGAFLEAAFPELAGRGAFYGLLWSDLTQASLVSSGLSGMMSEKGWESSRTSDMGKAFLRFIEDPLG